MSSISPRQPLPQLLQTTKPNRLRPIQHSEHRSRLIPMQPLHPLTLPSTFAIDQHSFPTRLSRPNDVFLILIPHVDFPPLVRIYSLLLPISTQQRRQHFVRGGEYLSGGLLEADVVGQDGEVDVEVSLLSLGGRGGGWLVAVVQGVDADAHGG